MSMLVTILNNYYYYYYYNIDNIIGSRLFLALKPWKLGFKFGAEGSADNNNKS